RASHIDPPASSYAIMQRACPYCGENPEPGKDVEGELEPRPGIREQPGSTADMVWPAGMAASLAALVRPCSGPASKGSWQRASRTRSTPCHTSSMLESPPS